VLPISCPPLRYLAPDAVELLVAPVGMTRMRLLDSPELADVPGETSQDFCHAIEAGMGCPEVADNYAMSRLCRGFRLLWISKLRRISCERFNDFC